MRARLKAQADQLWIKLTAALHSGDQETYCRIFPAWGKLYQELIVYSR